MNNAEKVQIFENVVMVEDDDPPLNKKIEACTGLEVRTLFIFAVAVVGLFLRYSYASRPQ